MRFRNLLLKNLIYYWRIHLGTILGAALSTAILVGALIIGDSVRYSLGKMVIERLGDTQYVLSTGDRYFRTKLADELANSLKTSVAPLLNTQGIVIAADGQRRANLVEIYGVDSRFGKIGKKQEYYNKIAGNEIIVNQSLALRLDLKVGDELLLRIRKQDFLPKDAPMALDSDVSMASRLTVRAIASESELGHFSLKTNQVVPNIAFLSLNLLAEKMELANRANIVLVAERLGNMLQSEELNISLKQNWSLEDAGFEFIKLDERNLLELRSQRIFLESSIVDAALEVDQNAKQIFTYFVNAISHKNKSTPYSFITGSNQAIISPDLKNDEIIVNSWLAKDLDINIGDELSVSYFVLGPMRDLIEKQAAFRLKKIVSLRGEYIDRDLMPNFPGLAGEENCRDWEPGVTIQLDNIRTKDERYWDLYGGTPKGFITLDAAQSMWDNRFGKLTAIRFKQSTAKEISQKVLNTLDPHTFGFIFQAVREEGMQASKESVDFAQLFLGLSFFIVLAALLLMSLLFVFQVERRSKENGLLLALGFSRRSIKYIIFSEGAILAILGGFIGGFLGILYNKLLLFALKTVWKDAVGTSALQMHVDFITVVIGVIISIIIALLSIWLVVRKQSLQSIAMLQSGSSKVEGLPYKGKSIISITISLICLISVLVILITTSPGRGKAVASSFFTAGTLLLISGAIISNILLRRSAQRTRTTSIKLSSIGLRNNARNRTRSLTLITLLASGLFIIFTVGANRHGAIQDIHLRKSGTGGFTLFAQSAIPVLYDLNSETGKRFYSLDEEVTNKTQFVPFKLKEGDDASCLNLNRVSNPHLLGVNPDELAQRNAFSFVNMTDEVNRDNPWLSLKQKLTDGVIPAIADETVIIWGLGKAVGDTLTYRDEKGNIVKLKLIAGLANSIFQGNVIIAENFFTDIYPSVSGNRLFLIDSPLENIESVSQNLSWAMQDLGFNPVSTGERLAEFNKVENTYLSIFLVLGGFGLILGTIGLAIVVLRNVFERRGELALLRAIGFAQKSIHSLILSEHLYLLLFGTLLGFFASLIAVLPALLSPGIAIPYLTIILIFLVVVISGAIWTYLATSMALREDLQSALRNE